VGTLVVDLFDTSTRKLIWRGCGKRYAIRQIRQEHRELNSDVQRMFEHFPTEVKD